MARTSRRVPGRSVQLPLPKEDGRAADSSRARLPATTMQMWRRVDVTPFPVTIPEADRVGGLPDKLVAELDGILNWALQGYAEFARLGSLRPPDDVIVETRAYRTDNDTVGQFIQTCCEHEQNSVTKELYEGYAFWCENSGFDKLPKVEFGKASRRRAICHFEIGPPLVGRS